MILLVSHDHDIHATEVLGHLRARNAEVGLVDLAQLPIRAALNIDYQEPCRPKGVIETDDGKVFDCTDASAIWWRRPMPFAMPEMADHEALRFSYNEWDAATTGLWQLAPCFWINEPMRDLAASRKAYQLQEAARAGLRIPRTLITSDPRRALEFIDEVGRDRTVYKVFSATEKTWRETRVLRESELALIDTLRVAPVIFQEYIEAEADLRITIVGDTCFPAAIFSQTAEYKADFRMEMDSMEIQVTELPEEITVGLRTFMDRLGLVYGAVDIRRTPSGEHIFLEVNTAGQWLFVEYETKQPIAETLANALADAAGPDR